jgi:hypothetical protein
MRLAYIVVLFLSFLMMRLLWQLYVIEAFFASVIFIFVRAMFYSFYVLV